MSKSMFVNVINNEESRIAIVSDGRLEELSIETAQQEQIEGNLYKARIVKVIASLDAVFVDYGRERNGFLAAPDIHPQYFRGDKRNVDALHKGQDLLVQVKKGEIGNKGAALTTYVSLPGRHFVLMPLVSKRGVSRRIEDETTRRQLRKILDDSGIPEDMGYIARTAAEGRTKQELTRDATYLLRLWKAIQARYEEEKGPALLYEETDIVIRTLRDYFTPSIEEVLIDDEGIYRQVEAFFQTVMPSHTKRLTLYQAQAPLFSKHNLEDQIASIYDKTVSLPSGGSLVIEQTEALVSIDVNSGKTTSGKDIEETALIANKEAAEEAARQLRLRDLGGLIVIDFIDMRPAKNRNEVRKVLQKALKEDKARTDTGTISKFGLLELSRQRLKGIARAGAAQTCPVCSGVGRIRTPEGSALSVLRRVQQRLPRKGAVRQVLVGVPSTVATLLQNRHRKKLLDLEARFDTEILVFSEPALAANHFYLEYRIKDRSEVETDLPESFPRAQLLAPRGLPELPNRSRRAPLYPLLDEEPEAIEVPAEPETDAEEASTPAAEAHREGVPQEGGKKRRRRRRRGRGTGAPTATEDATPATDSSPAEEPVSAEDQEPAEQTPANRYPEATRGQHPAAAAAAEADAEAAELAASGELRPVSASAKRRRRRRRTATGAPVGTDQPTQVASTMTVASEPAAPQPAPVADAAVATGPASAPAQATTVPTEPPLVENKPKRARRTRKTASTPAATEAGAPAATSTAATPEAETGPETTTPKTVPAKPRRTRKKAAPKPAAAAEPPQDTEPQDRGAPQASVTDAPTAEAKPAKPAPRARPSRRKSETETKAPAAVEGDEAAPAKKKPVRKRKAAKPAADGTTDAEPGPASD